MLRKIKSVLGKICWHLDGLFFLTENRKRFLAHLDEVMSVGPDAPGDMTYEDWLCSLRPKEREYLAGCRR